MRTLRETAGAFAGDEGRVDFARIECGVRASTCQKYAHAYPERLLFKNGTATQVPLGYTTVKEITDYVNRECRTERGLDGLIADSAGLVPAASAIAGGFVAAADRSGLVEQLRAIPGAEQYVRVAERFVSKGDAQIKKDMDAMRRILDERKVSWQTLDAIKKRYNVFTQFVPQVNGTAQTSTPSADL
jgi:hypothetical protein